MVILNVFFHPGVFDFMFMYLLYVSFILVYEHIVSSFKVYHTRCVNIYSATLLLRKEIDRLFFLIKTKLISSILHTHTHTNYSNQSSAFIMHLKLF